jgi:hypothetical protein
MICLPRHFDARWRILFALMGSTLRCGKLDDDFEELTVRKNQTKTAAALQKPAAITAGEDDYATGLDMGHILK